MQARVTGALAAAARRRAGDRGVSLSRYLAELVQEDLATAEAQAFWSAFSDYYADEHRVVEAQAVAESQAETLTDGWDPDDEAWGDRG